MEYLMEAALQEDPNYGIIAKNLQIIPGKITLGELDFLIRDIQLKEIIHLEMAYKFYLFDERISDDWSKCWVGTDRGDSLYLKLEKLRFKQLPLLWRAETQLYLDDLKIDRAQLRQCISLKGQLFLPQDKDLLPDQELNPAALAGNWMRKSDFLNWEDRDCLFYIPKKYRWIESLREEQVTWFSYEQTLEDLDDFLQQHYASMLWLKPKTGQLKRLMIVNWKD